MRLYYQLYKKKRFSSIPLLKETSYLYLKAVLKSHKSDNHSMLFSCAKITFILYVFYVFILDHINTNCVNFII